MRLVFIKYVLSKKKYWYFYLIFSIAFLLFLTQSAVVLDPDLGWHLRIGQYILAHSFPQGDPFSYTMPSYHFVYDEWLVEVLIAKLYSLIHVLGLGFIFSFFAIAAFYIPFVGIKKTKWSIVPLLLSVTVLLSSVRVNPQIISWPLFACVITILLRKGKKNSFIYFMPPLFLLWANIHGSFVVGLGLYFIFLFCRLYSNNLQKKDVIIFLLSATATLINPYGFGQYQEAIIHVFSPQLRQIAEWMPAFFIGNIPLWFLIVFSTMIVWKERKKFTLFQKIVYVILLLFGISSIRNMPFWMIVSLPMTTEGIEKLYNEIKTIKDGQARFRKAYIFLIGIVSIACVMQVALEYENGASMFSFSESVYYPQNAIVYIQNHVPSGNIFSTYGWGGYLLWKLPEKKTFIDGRMPTWINMQAPVNESKNAFLDSQNIMNGYVQFAPFVKKYDIEMVVLPNIPVRKQKSFIEIFAQWQNNVFHAPVRKYPNIFVQLRENGWRKVYEDSVAVIYEK